MSKKTTIAALSAIVLIIILYFSNPGEAKHLHFLQQKFNAPISWDQGTDSFTSEDGSQFNYNDFYVFSTTTTAKTNKRTSIGFLWMIF